MSLWDSSEMTPITTLFEERSGDDVEETIQVIASAEFGFARSSFTIDVSLTGICIDVCDGISEIDNFLCY